MSGAGGQRGGGAVAAGLLLLFSLLVPSPSLAQENTIITLDDFEGSTDWITAPSDGVSLALSPDSGRTGRAMRLDFDFQGHGGYAVARKRILLDLPENYAFTFWIRADAPVNNLEFKLVDSTGDNVWWRNQRAFTFPREWTRVTIRKRQIEFAWGPAGRTEARNIAAIEIAITAGTGGKGSVWFDDFQLEPRPPDRPYDLTPSISASSEQPGSSIQSVIDSNPSTIWQSRGTAATEVIDVDFHRPREFGGLTIDWVAGGQPSHYVVKWSSDRSSWTHRIVTGSNGGRDYLYLPESEARFVRLEMTTGGRPLGISSLDVKSLEWAGSPNDFFRAIARDAPRGSFPRYFEDVQSYWTMVGTNGDGRRSLLAQDGAFEPLPGGFSVEPFLWLGGKLFGWADAPSRPSLRDGYLPVPTVERDMGGVSLRLTATASELRGSPFSLARYQLSNLADSAVEGWLYLAVRPFQVNPSWQFLGVSGGVARIDSISSSGGVVRVNGQPRIHSSIPFVFGAATFDQGDISEYLTEGRLPPTPQGVDPTGYASGVLGYRLELSPGGTADVTLRFPLDDSSAVTPIGSVEADDVFNRVGSQWSALLSRVTISLPPGAHGFEQALKTSVAYMLINRDGAAIEPGARSYRRSWIRDGAMIGNAFLRMGHPEPVREFIEWYAPYQYETGKVPCCVDRRGADPVPEHDSHGQLIHIIAEYFRYTGDREFLARYWGNIERAARYIDSLRSTRRTPEYRQGAKRKFYGLMPPSISHEGYSAKPVHSYWDDFWVLKGLIDAEEIAAVLGKMPERRYLSRLRSEFQVDLHASIRRTIEESRINYIPGSADLADYDPTSTSIALEPAGQADLLPQKVLHHTFERYLREVRARRDSTEWEAYTPYEWRNVGALVRLGKPREARELLGILFDGRRPREWNQWPEVVYRDTLAPRFLGDLPHTWVGSDYVRSFLDLIAYVRQSDSTLVIGAGVPTSWVDESPGVTVRGLPIGRGKLDVRMTADSIRLEGTMAVPPGGILVYQPGTTSFTRITRLPATVRWRAPRRSSE